MLSDTADNRTSLPIEPGQIWLRKRGSTAVVRRVLSVADGKVHYEVLHGPTSLLRKRLGACKLRSFVQRFRPIAEQADYSHLDGAEQFETYLVLTTCGEPLLRCSEKRARFYLRKGYVRLASRGVLQFIDDKTEKTLASLYLGEFGEFFLAVKNDRCVCCGRTNRLSRHHIVPKRHKRKIPLPWRNCISNVLFVCLDCHQQYEQTPEPKPDNSDWKAFAHAWRDHFICVMKPKFLPAGWDIVSVTDLDAVKRGTVRT